LSRRVGVSGPQVHRYESGTTRIATSRLMAIAEVLGVSVETLTGTMPKELHAVRRAVADDDRASRMTRRIGQRSPTELDSAVGQRIRRRRIALGISLQELSQRVGVSGPQVHRYENGTTRIAASRLIAIAEVLGVSVQTLTGAMIEEPPSRLQETERLLSAFCAIDCPEQRHALLELARCMAIADFRE
jgi:transcriptional regulator with XRE-family HTH domain